MTQDRDNSRYPETYGTWAGNPTGRKPDYDRCCTEVWDKRGFRSSQCSNPRLVGPGKSYCKVHDPEAKAQRQAKSEQVYRDRLWEDAMSTAGPMVAVLKQIEAGHNDPRGLASDCLAKLRELHWWKPGE